MYTAPIKEEISKNKKKLVSLGRSDICTHWHSNEILNILNKCPNSQICRDIENQHLSKYRVRYFGLAFEMIKCRNTSVFHYLLEANLRCLVMKIPMDLKP